MGGPRVMRLSPRTGWGRGSGGCGQADKEGPRIPLATWGAAGLAGLGDNGQGPRPRTGSAPPGPAREGLTPLSSRPSALPGLAAPVFTEAGGGRGRQGQAGAWTKPGLAHSFPPLWLRPLPQRVLMIPQRAVQGQSPPATAPLRQTCLHPVAAPSWGEAQEWLRLGPPGCPPPL